MNIGNVLVVCIGNICRSPMAEALLRHEMGDENGITVTSAGLGALAGHPASEHSVALMAERGIDISGHRARQLTPDMVEASDLILVMESAHRRALHDVEPAARGKIYRLGEWQDQDIPDPYRQPREAFELALEMIDDGVADWVERIGTG